MTGAAGFLGAGLVSRLAGEAGTIIRVARSAQRPLDHGPDTTVIDVACDVTERGAWEHLVDADVIVHLAAQTSGVAAAEDPDADFRSNVMPMRHLLAACRDRKRRPTVLFAGTVTEAGVPSRLPVNEDAPDDPITVYDRHKLMAENELKDAVSEGVVFGTTLRLANVYGPGAHGRRADRDVLNRMIGRALIGQPLTVHGTGEYVRDYVFVDDAIDAFVRAVECREAVNGRYFVIGSGQGISIREAFELVAARVERSTGRRVPVSTIEPASPLSAIDRRHFVGDSSRFSRATGWRPVWSLTDGIDRTIEALTCA